MGWFLSARVQPVACVDIGVRSLAVTMLFKFGSVLRKLRACMYLVFM